MSEVMTDYSLPVITVTSPFQRAQKILAREQIGAHGRNGRTSSTTLSHDELFAQDSALVLIGQRRAAPPVCASAWLSSVRLGDGQPGSPEQVEEVAPFGV
jgi:hypothetical protein